MILHEVAEFIAELIAGILDLIAGMFKRDKKEDR